jgi:hypothetical protein
MYVVLDHVKGAIPVTNGSRDHAGRPGDHIGRLVDCRSSDQVDLVASDQVDQGV